MTTITQLHGDCLEILPTLPPASVQMVCTSPPYLALRDYGVPPASWPAIEYAPLAGIPPLSVPAWSGCLGLESDPLAYVAHLVHVFRLLRPALKADGCVWLNLGDSYAMDSKWGGRSGGKNYTSDEGNLSRARRQTGLKDKDLMLIPHRVALALQADGWWLRSDVVWHKLNAMPESVTDRPTKAHESVFLLAKSQRYYYDHEAIAEIAVNGDPGAPRSPRRAQPQGIDAHGGRRDKQRATGGRRYVGFNARWDAQTERRETRNARTVWTISTQPLQAAHYAPMPLALADRCIRAGSRPGDTVLDPFAGSGTTLRAAVALGRSAIGIELNAEYLAIQDERTAAIQIGLEAA